MVTQNQISQNQEIEELRRRIAEEWGEVLETRGAGFIIHNSETEIRYYAGIIERDNHEFSVVVEPHNDSHYAFIYVQHSNSCPFDY